MIKNTQLKAWFQPFAPYWEQFQAACARQYQTWIYWLPVFLGLGIAGYFTLSAEPSWMATGGVCVGFALIAKYLFKRQVIAWPMVILLMMIPLGFLGAKYHTIAKNTPLLWSHNVFAEIEGRVARVELSDKGGRLVIDDPSSPDSKAVKYLDRLQISTKQDIAHIRAGDIVRTRGKLSPPSTPLAPGAFDFQRHAYFKGIGAIGYTMGRVEVIDKSERTISDWVENFRKTIAGNIRAIDDGPSGSILIALMTGEKREIPKDLMEQVRNGGLAHLLSISGLHIGLVYGVVFFALRFLIALSPTLALRYDSKKCAALVALLWVLFYMVLTGASVATQRAVLMMGLVTLAVWMDRQAISLRVVSAVAFILLLFAPQSLLHPGFQMSFAAVIALVWFYETYQESLRNLWRSFGGFQKLSLLLLTAALSNLISDIATAPFAAYHFQQFQLMGMIINMVAVPLVTFVIMPLSLLAYLTMVIGLHDWVLYIMGIAVDIIIYLVEWADTFTYNVLYLPALPGISVFLIVLGSLIFVFWQGRTLLPGAVLWALGLLIYAAHDPVDLIIHDKGTILAWSAPGNTLYTTKGRADMFSKEIWQRHFGKRHLADFSGEVQTDDFTMSCNDNGCQISNGQAIVQISTDPSSLTDNCQHSDLIIATYRADFTCPNDVPFYNVRDAWNSDGYGVEFKQDHIMIIPLANLTGSRPWTVRYQKQQDND